MILQATVTKYITTNAYIYADNETKHGFLIDPGAQAGKLLELIREKGLTIEAILLTHGHFDHIGAVNELQAVLQIPVYMGEKGMLYAENPVWNLSSQTEDPIVLKDVTYLADHAVIALKEKPSFQLELLDLPGHTADGVIYYTKEDGAAFVGDSIFQGTQRRRHRQKSAGAAGIWYNVSPDTHFTRGTPGIRMRHVRAAPAHAEPQDRAQSYRVTERNPHDPGYCTKETRQPVQAVG